MKAASGFILACLFIGLAKLSYGQLNQDSLFREADRAVRENRLEDAAGILEQLHRSAPSNTDYTIYLGRVYSWKKDYANSVNVLAPLTSTNPPNAEALETLLNTFLWSENYLKVIEYADKGLTQIDSAAFIYRYRKAQALEKLERNEEALVLLGKLRDQDPRNKDVCYLQTQIWKKKRYSIAASYLNTSFSNPGFAPIQLASLQFKQEMKKSAYVARVNYGYLYQTSGTELELDYYPKIGRKTYLFLNSGASNGLFDSLGVFPDYRVGAEIYHGFAEKWETSAGVRYLNFSGTGVMLYTAYITRGVGNWSPAYRIYATIQGGKLYPSHLLSLRRTNEVNESYIQFDIHYGTIPYASFFNVNEFQRTSALRFGVQYEFRIGSSFFVRPQFMYEYEEYFPDLFRNRFNTQLMLTKRF